VYANVVEDDAAPDRVIAVPLTRAHEYVYGPTPPEVIDTDTADVVAVPLVAGAVESRYSALIDAWLMLDVWLVIADGIVIPLNCDIASPASVALTPAVFAWSGTMPPPRLYPVKFVDEPYPSAEHAERMLEKLAGLETAVPIT